MEGDNTERGLRNQMFGVFIFVTIFNQLIQQMMPVFVAQRTLYEARERPAKSYSWVAFLAANIFVELFWNSVSTNHCRRGGYHSDPSTLDHGCLLIPLLVLSHETRPERCLDRFCRLPCLHFIPHLLGLLPFLEHVWASDDLGPGQCRGCRRRHEPGLHPDVGLLRVATTSLLAMFTASLTPICSVLAVPGEFPGFWIFMYRVNPFTYIVEAFLSVGLANAPVTCSATELLTFVAPSDSTCGDYMADYIRARGGYLVDANATECQFCTMADTNAFLESMDMSFGNRWRDFWFIWAYCVFNIFAAAGLYWIARVPKNDFKKRV